MPYTRDHAKISLRPQETRSRAARLSQASGSSPLSILSLSSTRLQAHPRTLILHGIIIPPIIRLRLLHWGKDNCRGRMCRPTHPPRRTAYAGSVLQGRSLLSGVYLLMSLPGKRYASRPSREAQMNYLGDYPSLRGGTKWNFHACQSCGPPFLLSRRGVCVSHTSSPPEPTPAS